MSEIAGTLKLVVNNKVSFQFPNQLTASNSFTKTRQTILAAATYSFA
jgi:hypothetical protein